MEFIYFDVAHAIREHDYIIEATGGLHGIDKQGQLESILDFVQDDIYYPTLEEKASYLFYSINKGHCFADGNKRSSIALTAYFLEINGLENIAGKFMREMENFAVDLAANIISRELLFEIICSLIYLVDFTEELKLEIYNAKQKWLLEEN